MSQHALLSPSSAHRWLACPASVAASAGLQDTPSEHAVVGTVAHDIAARPKTPGVRSHEQPPKDPVALRTVMLDRRPARKPLGR